MTKNQIEKKLIEMFLHQQSLEETGRNEEVYFNGVKDVWSFDGYLVTMDKGVVVDLADGTQICLTIQIR